jgi:hypothetical protein
MGRRGATASAHYDDVQSVKSTRKGDERHLRVPHDWLWSCSAVAMSVAVQFAWRHEAEACWKADEVQTQVRSELTKGQ